MNVCTYCGCVLTFTEADGWVDEVGRMFCGPGRTTWHLPEISDAEIEADARAFVDDLRSTATARGQFFDGKR